MQTAENRFQILNLHTQKTHIYIAIAIYRKNFFDALKLDKYSFLIALYKLNKK